MNILLANISNTYEYIMIYQLALCQNHEPVKAGRLW